jgi:hypothetical protein
LPFARFAERKAMIDREHDLPITRQTETLNVSRGRILKLVQNLSKPFGTSIAIENGVGVISG